MGVLMSKNYFSNFDINKGSFGFSLFNTSFVNNTPTTITAGAGGLTLSVVGGGLRNKVSLELNKPGAINTQGQGLISDVLTLDRADLARVLRFAFEFERTAGTIDASGTSMSSFEVWIYDVTNNSWIQPSGFRGITQITLPGTCSGEFQPPSTALALRLAIIYRQTDTNLWTMRFDEFELLQQSRARGAVVTDWQSYTPTGSHTTNTSYAGRWRRVGDSVELQVRVAYSGANSQGGLLFTQSQILPTGLSVDSNKVNLGVDIRLPVGGWAGVDSGVNGGWEGEVVMDSGFNFTLSYVTTAGQSVVSPSQPFAISAGDNFNLSIKAPIAGWSSNVQMSNDTDTRVVALAARQLSPISVTANNPIPYSAVDFDTHGGFNNPTPGRYRIPVSGIYRLSVTGIITSSTQAELELWVNGVNTLDFTSVASNATRWDSGSVTRQLNAGDIIDVRPNSTATVASYFFAERLSGPSQIAASETVIAEYRATAGQTILGGDNTNIMQFNTRYQDTHNAWDTAQNRFITPISGTYEVTISSMIVASPWTAGGRTLIQPLVNSAAVTGVKAIGLTWIQASTTLEVWTAGTIGIRLNAGDILQFNFIQNSGTARNFASTGVVPQMFIRRVGN